MASRCKLLRPLRAHSRPLGLVPARPIAAQSQCQSPCSARAATLASRTFATSSPRALRQSPASLAAAATTTKLTADKYPAIKRDTRFAQVTPEHVAYFKDLLGADSAVVDGVNSDAEGDLQPFNEDWMHKYRGQCRLVLKPASTEEVSKILKYCNDNLLAVVPQGGNTGLVGGSVPVFDEIVINVSRMNQIHSFDEVSGSLVVDAGCILEVADQFLASKGYIFPLDLGAKGSCHIGGNVSTNAGGLRLLRYGSLHGTVLGIEAVLPDGTIMNDLCTLRKNNTGYDLKQLFIGAEGTIGIITKIAIHCPQRSSAVNVAFFGLESYEKAQLAFREAKTQLSEILSAFELMDSDSQRFVHTVKGDRKPLDDDHPFYCLIETSGSNADHDYEKLEKFLEDVMSREIVSDGVVAQDETQARALWGWREGITECLGHWGGVYKYDVSIPLKEMYSLVDDVKARMEEKGLLGDKDEHPVVGVVGYGHMGDSNLHLNVPVRRYDAAVEQALEPYVYEWIAKRNGSISAEHGLGLAKKDFVGYSKDETMLKLMKQIKNLYDPCSNERPFCQKCLTSGRQCEGYERQRVFITGTLETKGRVASHPKKSGGLKQKDRSSGSEDRDFEVSPTLPLTSAWDTHVSLTNSGSNGDCPVLVTALQMSIPEITVQNPGAQSSSAGFKLQLPAYSPADVRPLVSNHIYDAEARCFLCLASVEEGSRRAGENYCAFLFEHGLSAEETSSSSSWSAAPEQASMVYQMGPRHFSSFPDHYFFVRIYRPMALSVALLSRRETFLASPEWTTVPWELHPKSLLDQLFDLMLFLPAIFARTDRLLSTQPTLQRRTEAMELLHNCLTLERQFHAWLELSIGPPEFQSLPYWTEETASTGTSMPFSTSYSFKDSVTGLMFLYYWMSQILFHQCIVSLNRAIFQPAIDTFPNMWPNIPANLQIDESQYQHSRDFAADICRGLDYVLNNMAQPDILLAPMTVALEYFKEINALSQYGLLEIVWLEAFKDRLVSRGQQIANALQGQRWIELARS
ncbi:putative D-lactate dehydrogenase [Paramyrothecium foliicola]|nr:putative D-lactate dehydrogenase [Paramyrothecium foliicola]